MKKACKYLTLAVTMVFVFAIAGCTSTNQKPTTTAPFIGGTTGLLINFVQDSPPNEVFDGGSFPFAVVVKLENDGEFTIPKNNVRVEITGVRAEEYGLTPHDLIKGPDDDLLGTQKDSEGNVVESPPAFVTFEGFNHKDPISGTFLDATFRASACYLYQTKANAKICVRQNILQPEKGGVCEINEAKKAYNSGGPLQVTSFTEAARAKDKVSFTFKIEQKGNGNVFKKGMWCNQSFTNEDMVFVEVNSGIPRLKCSGFLGEATETSGYVRLLSGSAQDNAGGATLTCTQDIASPSDYESTIEIKASYDYKESKETQVLVKHSIG